LSPPVLPEIGRNLNTFPRFVPFCAGTVLFLSVNKRIPKIKVCSHSSLLSSASLFDLFVNRRP
jgi:hypothetical protein